MDPARDASPPPAVRRDCRILEGDFLREDVRELVLEEPLTIAASGRTVTRLTYTPGDEENLAIGFLLTEGMISSMSDVRTVSFCADNGNAVRVEPAEGADVPRRIEERLSAPDSPTPSDAIIQDIGERIPPFRKPPGRLEPTALFELMDLMQERQDLFRRTGCTHAAALGTIRNGKLTAESVIVREDIGRHNALDKAVGQALRAGLDLGQCLLALSSRAGFQMIAKAAFAGISDVAAVGAASALGARLADRLDMFLAGFVRNGTATVYSGADALTEQP